MSNRNQLKIKATKKVKGETYTQSANIINGHIQTLEKRIEDDDGVIQEQIYSANNSKDSDAEMIHPMDYVIEHAFVMTSKVPLAGPYVKKAMDESRFTWMVREFVDVVFKPIMPMPKIKK